MNALPVTATIEMTTAVKIKERPAKIIGRFRDNTCPALVILASPSSAMMIQQQALWKEHVPKK